MPDEIATGENGPACRCVATRDLLEQPELPGMEGRIEPPFPAPTIEKKRCKIFGVVTNRDLDGGEPVDWLRKRCGTSEEARSLVKEDLAGGKLPSSGFGENAAWRGITILAFNLDSAMKRLVLKGSWVTKKMKAIGFSLIGVPGRVTEHARELVVRLAKGHPSSHRPAADHEAWSCAVRVSQEASRATTGHL